MNDPRRAALALVLWMAPIVACLSGATVAQAAQADDEAAIRLLAQDWISTQELEKLDAFLALWAPDAPGAERRRDFTPVVFQSGNDRFTDVRIDRVTIDAGRGTVRVVADRERTLPGGNTIPSQVAVVFECVRTPDGWRLLAESSAYAAFADELIGLTDQAAIDARLDADRRLLGRELLRALGERGDRGSFTGSLDRAMVAYRLVRSIALRLGDADAAIAALQNIGNVHFFRQNYADALESYKERLAEETARGDKAGMATALQAIASAHYAFADYVAALDAYRRALDILEPLDDRPALASLYMNVGNVYLLQGDYAAAVESFGRSRILFEAMPDHTGPAARAQHGEGRAETARGNFQAAIAALESALEKFRRSRDRGGVPETLGSLAYVHYLRGDHARAIALYMDSLDLEKIAGNTVGVARALQSIGLVELVRGGFKEAVEAYTRSRDLFGALRGRDAGEGRAFATLGLGFAQTAVGAIDDALASYGQASAAFETLGRREQVGRAALGASMAHAARHAAQESLDAATRAAAIGRETASRDLEWRARVREGYALLALERADGARQAFESAVAIVEDPAELDGDEPGAPSDDDRGSPHAGLAEAFAVLGEPRAALAAAERGRLRRLRDQLALVRDAIHAGMTGEEREEERRLRREVVSIHAQLTREARLPKPDPNRLASLAERLRRATAERDSFTAQLYGRLPELARWRGDLAAGEVDAALAPPEHPDTAVLSFTIFESRVLAFVGRQGDAAPTMHVMPGSAKELHEHPEAIVAPLAGRLAGATTIVIVPQGFLWRVPFQTLAAADGSKLTGDAAISYAGSLTLHARIRSMTADERAPLRASIASLTPTSPFYSTLSIEDRPLVELRALFTTPLGASRVRVEEPPSTEPPRPIDDAMHAVQWALTAAGVQTITVGRVTLGVRAQTN
ncbi:MAG TPA: tetratricopeptide repeat protein [Vicinamibacterales bacterium]|jgi:tetratricopeptide (TPR) repeat protein|nr:tetratricopeptide repeat protein [Vicinamibacterales bacterium]